MESLRSSSLFPDFSELVSEWSEDDRDCEPVPCELLLLLLLDEPEGDASELLPSLRDFPPLSLELSLESLLLLSLFYSDLFFDFLFSNS